jgi:uncharacterized protein (DUF1810 family)
MESLDRFKVAQAHARSGIDSALGELRRGRKTSHWIWYIFPQLGGLGHSHMAQLYGLRDLDEACAYLEDPQLRENYLSAIATVEEQIFHQGNSLVHLMGGQIDMLKLVSSLTLFREAALSVAARTDGDDAFAGLADACERILDAAAREGFPRCSFTLSRLAEMK